MADLTNKTITALLEEAIKLEKEGERFYVNAAKKTTDPFSKTLINRLADDEIEHCDLLMKQLDSLATHAEEKEQDAAEWKEEFSHERLTIFSTDLEQAKNSTVKDDNNLDILKQAIDIEKKAVNLYTNALVKVDNDNIKHFLRFMVSVEEQHRDLLTDYLNYLEEPVAGWDNMERWACQS